MERFGKAVVRCRYGILILAILLLIPSILGYRGTRINYDVLTYLPKDIETMKGQEILTNEFGTGALSMMVVEDMSLEEVSALKEEIVKIPHVKQALWYDSFLPLSVPVDVLPNKVKNAFMKDGATLLVITYDTGSSADETMDAVEAIRKTADEHCYLAGITGIVTDTRNLADREEPVYVLIAVLLALVVLSLTMDNFLAPILFLVSIGMAILYNLGSNIFFGEISYVTKALAAVLQLGVTMDYSIFLWHSYEENLEKTPGDRKQAMAAAIGSTLQSVVGSSITTIAGFIALCFMSFTLGLDIGLVMAKGVVLGVAGCVTILPSLILIFDKALLRMHHRPLLPKLSALPGFVAKHYKAILLVFAIVWIPAIYGYTHTNVYYQLDASLPESLPSVTANRKLSETFNMQVTHMLLVDRNVKSSAVEKMCEEMRRVDGVEDVLGIDALLGANVPRNRILDRVDPKGMLIGEAPLTKDLITITDHDFNVVNWVSIAFIFLIIFFVFRSVSLPVLLVLVIEFAIFINMGIPGYTGTELPFVASIVIGTIQLGSTVDYAILMTSRYLLERKSGADKKTAVEAAHRASIQSIIVSALSFFAATFGVGVYSTISMISSLCVLMARGALISMVVVLLVLPAVLLLFDPLIIRTSLGFRKLLTNK